MVDIGQNMDKFIFLSKMWKRKERGELTWEGDGLVVVIGDVGDGELADDGGGGVTELTVWFMLPLYAP